MQNDHDNDNDRSYYKNHLGLRGDSWGAIFVFILALAVIAALTYLAGPQ